MAPMAPKKHPSAFDIECHSSAAFRSSSGVVGNRKARSGQFNTAAKNFRTISIAYLWDMPTISTMSLYGAPPRYLKLAATTSSADTGVLPLVACLLYSLFVHASFFSRLACAAALDNSCMQELAVVQFSPLRKPIA
jgi:hypothetical protein